MSRRQAASRMCLSEKMPAARGKSGKSVRDSEGRKQRHAVPRKRRGSTRGKTFNALQERVVDKYHHFRKPLPFATGVRDELTGYTLGKKNFVRRQLPHDHGFWSSLSPFTIDKYRTRHS